MPLFLSVHAVRQMGDRGISREEVAEVVANPHTTYRSEEKAACLVILGVTSKGAPLKVVVREDDHHYIVTVARRDRED